MGNFYKIYLEVCVCPTERGGLGVGGEGRLEGRPGGGRWHFPQALRAISVILQDSLSNVKFLHVSGIF